MPDVNSVGIVLGALMLTDGLYSVYRVFYIQSLFKNVKNYLMFVLDICIGIFLIYGSLIEEPIRNRILLSVVVISIGTMIFRNMEWSQKKETDFCTSVPHWLVNNLKLLGLFLLIFSE